MFFKSKYLICALLISFILTFLFSTYSFAFYEDSIYVWSNNASTIATSSSPNDNTNILDNTR